MSIPWAELVLLALAAWAAVEAWGSTLFVNPRAYLEVWRDEFTGWRHWVGELLLCPFCLLYHAVWICWCVDQLGGRPLILWLATVRLATAGLRLMEHYLHDNPALPEYPGPPDDSGATGDLPRQAAESRETEP